MSLRSFFKYLDTNFKTTAPLYNWRHIFGDASAFPAFKEKFLTPTGELADTIFCISSCEEGCGSRQIVHDSDGKIRAVCRKNNESDFVIDRNEIGVHKLKINSLTENMSKTLKDKSSIPESFRKNNYPVQYVFPFAKRHIYKEIDGESEKWYVDGKLKKIYGPKKKNSLQSKILNILYNQIDNGWIPHKTFINATGWTEKDYFGKDRNNPGRMQRLLFQLRKKLGIKIEFNKNMGVKFPVDIVLRKNS